jgi:hypothetical protein
VLRVRTCAKSRENGRARDGATHPSRQATKTSPPSKKKSPFSGPTRSCWTPSLAVLLKILYGANTFEANDIQET